MSRCKSKIKLLLMLQLFGAISALAIEASSRHELAPLGAELNQISLADVQEEGHSFSNVSLKIINGYDAKPGEFPFYVSVSSFDRKGRLSHNCGGTILSPNIILTAARCVHGKILGELAVQPTQKFPSEETNWMRVSKACVHKDYKYTFKPSAGQLGLVEFEIIFDVAILKLHKDIEFSEHVQKAHLPTAELPYDAQAYAVGLGFNNTSVRPFTVPETLQALLVQRVQCPDGLYGPQHYSKLCTKANQKYHIGSACEGDNGGPIVWNNNGNQTVFGVYSHGIPIACLSGWPTVSADVYNLLDDINDLMRECSS